MLASYGTSRFSVEVVTIGGAVVSAQPGAGAAVHAGGGGGERFITAHELGGCWLAWGTCFLCVPVLGAIICHNPKAEAHYVS